MEENPTAPDVVKDVGTHQGPKNTATWKTPTGKPPEKETLVDQPGIPEEPADVTKPE